VTLQDATGLWCLRSRVETKGEWLEPQQITSQRHSGWFVFRTSHWPPFGLVGVGHCVVKWIRLLLTEWKGRYQFSTRECRWCLTRCSAGWQCGPWTFGWEEHDGQWSEFDWTTETVTHGVYAGGYTVGGQQIQHGCVVRHPGTGQFVTVPLDFEETLYEPPNYW